MPEIKPPAPEPMPRKKSSSVVVITTDDGGQITLSLDELLKLRDTIRNNVLCGVLSAVTDKLNPGGNIDRELALVEVLRSVNNLRTEEAGNENRV